MGGERYRVSEVRVEGLRVCAGDGGIPVTRCPEGWRSDGTDSRGNGG